jgi:hypothetical protein
MRVRDDAGHSADRGNVGGAGAQRTGGPPSPPPMDIAASATASSSLRPVVREVGCELRASP